MSHNNLPREKGARFERRIADFCASRGLPFDRGPQRGKGDRGDLAGTAPYGVAVECKWKARGQALRLGADMREAELEASKTPAESGHIAPVLIPYRYGYGDADQFAIMRLDDWTTWAAQRRAVLLWHRWEPGPFQRAIAESLSESGVRADRLPAADASPYEVLAGTRYKSPGQKLDLSGQLQELDNAAYGSDIMTPVLFAQRAGGGQWGQYVVMRLGDWCTWAAERHAARPGQASQVTYREWQNAKAGGNLKLPPADQGKQGGNLKLPPESPREETRV